MSISISKRFLINIGGNFARSVLSFIIGILLARWLSPEKFGIYSFLLVSFTSLKVLTDLAVSNAFFTFISKVTRSRVFVFYYWLWILIQFLIPALAIAALLPEDTVKLIWDTSDKKFILLALSASSMQGSVWSTASQLGESQRRNRLVQSVGVLITAINLVSIYVLKECNLLELNTVFLLLSIGWGLASFIVARSYRSSSTYKSEGNKVNDTFISIFREYKLYCQPLFFYGILTFIFEFSDRWMLQRWGGNSEQAFFSVAQSFSAIALLATTSTLNIFWKEISEASHHNNKELIARLYNKFKRILYFSATFISCALIPWHKEIIEILVGGAYNSGAMAFMIMCLYPIHQTIGQIDGTLMYSTGETKLKMKITIWFTIGSLLITYFTLAPSDALIPGLGMASVGMAIKMVLFQIICVNIINYVIAKKFNWDYQFGFQLLVLAIFLTIAFITYYLSNSLLPENFHFVIKIMLGSLIYFISTVVLIFKIPSLAGLSVGEPKAYLDYLIRLGKK